MDRRLVILTRRAFDGAYPVTSASWTNLKGTLGGSNMAELLGVLIVLLAVWLIRRLLGIQRGRWVATVMAVLVGEAATVIVFRAIRQNPVELPTHALLGAYALVTVFAMLTLVLVELLVRPEARRPPRSLPHLLRAVPRLAGRTIRYTQVSRIVIRRGLFHHDTDDATQVNGSRLGRSLRATFEDAGGMFVKLGQAMAAQPQLVTRAVAAELARLQDQAAPADPAAAKLVLEQELGPSDEVFAELADTPIGSASIAQTYLARLRDGRQVVVKVQRPGVADVVERDLDILGRLATRLERRTTWARALGLTELVAGFAERTREELDFRIEAANAIAVQRTLRDADPIRIPVIIGVCTTRRVLVEELVDGRGVGTPGVLDALDGDQRQALADGLLGLVVRQMLGGEPFHADPHPGNVFLCSDGLLALLDFGAVGRLDPFERSGLIDLLRGLQGEDASLLREAALQIGTPSTRVDEQAFDRALAQLLARSSRPDGTMNPALFGDALMVFRDFGIVLPRSTATLFRTLVTLLGTLETIAPGYQVAEGVRRTSGELTAQQVVPRNLQELALQEALNAGPVLHRLPHQVDGAARALLRGELRTRVSLLSEPEDVRAARSMLNRLVIGLIGSALALTSAILLSASSRPVLGGVSLVNLLGGIGLFFAVLLLLRLVVQILREDG
jgi:ubiquinone biosynthesis protein